MFKSQTQPRCRFCGVAIRKRTRTVLFGQGAYRPNDFVTQHSAYPASKEEAQRLLNARVVAVKWSRGDDYYAKKAGHDFICQASTWDGESYVSEHFCNGDHARAFGRVAAAAGFTMKAYREAMERDAKKKR